MAPKDSGRAFSSKNFCMHFVPSTFFVLPPLLNSHSCRLCATKKCPEGIPGTRYPFLQGQCVIEELVEFVLSR